MKLDQDDKYHESDATNIDTMEARERNLFNVHPSPTDRGMEINAHFDLSTIDRVISRAMKKMLIDVNRRCVFLQIFICFIGH